MKYKLNKEEAQSMEEVVHFILEFEHDDYVDWCKREDDPKGHVYYHANLLAGRLLEWQGEEDCCESQARAIREREEFFADSFNYEQKIL